MAQEHTPHPTATGWRTLARVLAAAAFVSVPLGIPTATADTVTVAEDLPAVTAAQSGPDRTAPCRRWQNPNAYGHWHCR